MDKNNKIILVVCAVACFYLLLRYSALTAMLSIFKESRDKILESQNQQEKRFKEAKNSTQAIFDSAEKRFNNSFNRFKQNFKSENDKFAKERRKKDIALASGFDEKLSEKSAFETTSQLNEPNETMVERKDDKKAAQSLEKAKKTENPSPYGITIGKTTKNEIYSKFSVIKESSWTDVEGYITVILDEKNFYSQNLPVKEVIAVINPQGIVVALQTTIRGDYFSELHTILANKYAVTYIEDPYVGDHKGEYEIGNINIILDKTHMSFDTVLIYITKKTDTLLAEYAERCNKRENQSIADSL